MIAGIGGVPVILMASDVVGLQITEFLVQQKVRIERLVLDGADRGRQNGAIRQAVEGHLAPTDVISTEAFAQESELRRLGSARPLLGILAWWPRILKGPALELPRLGWLNLHPGYLPYNRGKHPNFWCLVEGTPCGAALHWIDDGIDTGPLLARGLVEAGWEDTGESIHRKCRALAVRLFTDSFEGIVSGRIKAIAQPEGEGSAHRGNEIELSSEIDLERDYQARRLLNLIRARMFPPHPTAYFHDGGKKYSVQVVIKELPE